MEPLTPRQQEVLQHLAIGDRSPEIAIALQISPDTAKKHIKTTLQRLDARTSANAVAIALSTGLIQFPGIRETD